MDASVAVVMGAGIGALGGLGGGWITVPGQDRHQVRQRTSAERERWRLEVRRDAYNSFERNHAVVRLSYGLTALPVGEPATGPEPVGCSCREMGVPRVGAAEVRYGALLHFGCAGAGRAGTSDPALERPGPRGADGSGPR
jgi:hypothetical protein